MCYMGTQFREKFFKSQQHTQDPLESDSKSNSTASAIYSASPKTWSGWDNLRKACRHETQSKIYTNVSYFQTKAFIIDDSVRLFVHQRIGLIQGVEQRDPVRGLE